MQTVYFVVFYDKKEKVEFIGRYCNNHLQYMKDMDENLVELLSVPFDDDTRCQICQIV